MRVDPHPDGELGRLAEAINRMASEVEEARRREQRLLTTVSDDLRTPLTSTWAYAKGSSDGNHPEQQGNRQGGSGDRLGGAPARVRGRRPL